MQPNEAEVSMKRILDLTLQDLNAILTGIINTEVIRKIIINQQGVPAPLSQVAMVTRPSSTSLRIKPFDRLSLNQIEKALAYARQAGVTILNDGETVTLDFPPLTANRKKELIRLAGGRAESGRRELKSLAEGSILEIRIAEEEGAITTVQSSSQQAEVTVLLKRHIGQIDEQLSVIVNNITAG